MLLRFVIFIVWICGVLGLRAEVSFDVHKSAQSTPVQKHVVIWVHGTKLTPTPVWHTFFFRLEGMHSISKYDQKYHLRKLAESFVDADKTFSLDDFYVFGWSGRLSFKERLTAARNFDKCLELLNQEYKQKYGATPLFDVVTHSHGGNVALDLTKTKTGDFPYSINRLILLACPVQDETKDCLSHGLFKQVISFYSPSDMIQVIDPQGLYSNETKASSLFSKRLFPHHEKLVQIKTTRAARGLMHIEFLSLKFVQYLPHVLQQLPELLHKNTDSCHCLFDLSTERRIFKSPTPRPPFSLSVCPNVQ